MQIVNLESRPTKKLCGIRSTNGSCSIAAATVQNLVAVQIRQIPTTSHCLELKKFFAINHRNIAGPDHLLDRAKALSRTTEIFLEFEGGKSSP